MKKIILLLCLLYSMNTLAQNNIQLNIHHKLGEAEFEMNMAAKNNLDHDFKVNRLEYYISEIYILHDGEMETLLEDVYILADASEPTQVDLGNHAINQIESMKFSVGVEKGANHSDPAAYPSDHPLAPQFPSMHWGWTAGYRFVAYEGRGGSSLNQIFQLHGLEDENYFQTSIPVTATAVDSQIIINIDADYTRALEDIQVNSGPIVHGGYGDAKKCLENFRDYVFSPSGAITSTIDISEINHFKVFPNPSLDGQSTIALSTSKNLIYQIEVVDVLGRVVQVFDKVQGSDNLDLNIKQSGMYFVNLIKEGELVKNQKLVVH